MTEAAPEVKHTMARCRGTHLPVEQVQHVNGQGPRPKTNASWQSEHSGLGREKAEASGRLTGK